MDETMRMLMRRYDEMEQCENTHAFVIGDQIIWPAEMDDYFSREEISLLESAFQQPVEPLEP